MSQRNFDQIIREDDAIIAGLVRDLAAANATNRKLKAQLQQASSDPKVSKQKLSTTQHPDPNRMEDTGEPQMRSDLYPHESHDPKPIVVHSRDYRELLKDRADDAPRRRDSHRARSPSQEPDGEQKFHETKENIEEFGKTQDSEEEAQESGTRGRTQSRSPKGNQIPGSSAAKGDQAEPSSGEDSAPNYFKYLQHHDPDKLSRIGEKGGHNSHKNDGKRSRSGSRSRDQDDDEQRGTKRQKIQA